MSVKIVKNLSEWFAKNARNLPWRGNPDPYWVWLSEIMCQQTQVATVLPYFERFLTEFPTVDQLARARVDRVLKLWAGLGYYSRARNLHQGAVKLNERISSGLGFPRTAAEWLEIPGVGPYTAGAIASIAFQERAPIVDGNVVRVLSRVYGIRKLDSKKAIIWRHSTRLVECQEANPRVLNQALMELGALVCKPRRPDCTVCPIRSQCKGKGSPEDFPLRSRSKPFKRVLEQKWIPIREKNGNHEVLLIQNPAGKWREGLWDFPDPEELRLPHGEWVAEFKLNYIVTRHRVERNHLALKVPSKGLKSNARAKWYSLSDLPGIPAPVKKALEALSKSLKSVDF